MHQYTGVFFGTVVLVVCNLEFSAVYLQNIQLYYTIGFIMSNIIDLNVHL